MQCGYCINGMIMQAAAFLAKNKKPTEAEIKNALANNLCRCGTHLASSARSSARAIGVREAIMNMQISRRERCSGSAP